MILSTARRHGIVVAARCRKGPRWALENRIAVMRVAAIGYASVHRSIDPVAFASDQSILDYDAVIWSPAGLETEYRDAYTNVGEDGAAPLLSVAASSRLLQDVRRRRQEIARFLGRGRIIIVEPPRPVPLRVHIIEDVIDFNAMEALPQRLRLSAPPPDAAVAFRGGQPFRAFAERVPARTRARAAFDRFPGAPLFFAGREQAVVGGYVYQHPGHLLFLPLPEAAGRAVDDALLALIARIDGAGFSLDLPDWSADYPVPGERAARDRLRTLLTEQETLSQRLEEGRRQIRDMLQLKAVFAGRGAAFLAAITTIFQAFGAVVLSGPLSDDSVAIEDDARFLVVVAIDGTAEADAVQRLENRLDRFRNTFFSDAKGAVIHSRGLPPQQAIVDDAMAARLAAAGHAYLTGLDLLHLATAEPSGRTALDRIFAATGRPTGLPDRIEDLL